eukprot:scaffold117594_cov63-Phaeocystis_antarctica.AAC.2
MDTNSTHTLIKPQDLCAHKPQPAMTWIVVIRASPAASNVAVVHMAGGDVAAAGERCGEVNVVLSQGGRGRVRGGARHGGALPSRRGA